MREVISNFFCWLWWCNILVLFLGFIGYELKNCMNFVLIVVNENSCVSWVKIFDNCCFNFVLERVLLSIKIELYDLRYGCYEGSIMFL